MLYVGVRLPFALYVDDGSALVALPELLLRFLSRTLALPVIPLLSIYFQFREGQARAIS